MSPRHIEAWASLTPFCFEPTGSPPPNYSDPLTSAWPLDGRRSGSGLGEWLKASLGPLPPPLSVAAKSLLLDITSNGKHFGNKLS